MPVSVLEKMVFIQCQQITAFFHDELLLRYLDAGYLVLRLNNARQPSPLKSFQTVVEGSQREMDRSSCSMVASLEVTKTSEIHWDPIVS